MGQQKSTAKLRVENFTSVDIINTDVYSVDSYDWASEARPDHNFKHISIKSGNSFEQIEEMNGRATNCPFNMKLFFRDGSSDEFRLHMKYAVNRKSDSGFSKLKEDHVIELIPSSNNLLIIRIRHTSNQLNDVLERNIRGEAQSLFNQKKYTEALLKIKRGLGFVQNSETRDILENMKKEIEDQLTVDYVNKRVEDLLKLGNMYVDHQKYDEAMYKVYEAESIAPPNIKNKINELKGKIKSLQAEELLQKALAAENNSKDEDINENLLLAKNLFQEANDASPKWEYRQKFAIISNKIKGDELFNKTKNLKSDAFDLYQNNMFQKSKEKYMEALSELQKAKEKYLISDMFERNVQSANNLVTGIQKLLDDIEDKL